MLVQPAHRHRPPCPRTTTPEDPHHAALADLLAHALRAYHDAGGAVVTGQLVAAAAAAVFAFRDGHLLRAVEQRAADAPLVRRDSASVSAEADVRFVHQVLQRLVPVLPPANGAVIVAGTALLIAQGVIRSWDVLALMPLAAFWTIPLYIIVIAHIAADVRAVRETDSASADLDTVARNVRP